MDTQTSAGRPALLDHSYTSENDTLPAAESVPSTFVGEAGFSSWLPGLESTSPLSPEDVWLQGALLGPFSADIVGYLGLARTTGGPVLDLGAGAGRLAVPFARHGFRVEAVDRDEPSLSRLHAWASRIGPRVRGLVTTTRADLTELRLNGCYRLAVLGGAMIAAVPPSARRSLLHEIALHLGDGGALALDYTAHEPAGLLDVPYRRHSFQVPRFDGTLELVLAHQAFHPSTMRERIIYDCERSAHGRTHRSQSTTDKWIVDPARLDHDLRAAGLRITAVSRHRIDDRTRSVLLVCTPDCSITSPT